MPLVGIGTLWKPFVGNSPSTQSQVLLPKTLRRTHFQVPETLCKPLRELRLPDLWHWWGGGIWRYSPGEQDVAWRWIHFPPLPCRFHFCHFYNSMRPEQNVLLHKEILVLEMVIHGPKSGGRTQPKSLKAGTLGWRERVESVSKFRIYFWI